MAKFKVITDYNEAVARKEELVKKITEYNEALFNDKELPYSDEEMALFQEEYQFLDEYVELTPIEKEALKKTEKLEYVEKKQEDGSVKKVVKVTFWDKVNPLIFIYAVAAFISSLWFAIQGIGVQIIDLTGKIIEKNNIDISSWVQKDFDHLFLGLFAIYPILLIIISVITTFAICRKKETRRVAYIILAAQTVLVIISYFSVMFKVHLLG